MTHSKTVDRAIARLGAGEPPWVWETSKRVFRISDRPLLMGILNATPDSF